MKWSIKLRIGHISRQWIAVTLLCEAKELLLRGKELYRGCIRWRSKSLNTFITQAESTKRSLCSFDLERMTLSIKLWGMALCSVGIVSQMISPLLSYLTEETKCIMYSLLPFATVTHWGKKLSRVLMEFTSMNLCMERTNVQCAGHECLQAVESLYDGFVKNVWLYQCPADNNLNFKISIL